MKRIFWITGMAAVAAAVSIAQTDFNVIINKRPGQVPALAVPDFRGDGPSQSFMATFNRTLWNDLDGSGFFDLVPKSHYPLNIPQQLSDFKNPGSQPSGGGISMADWSSPPAQANYLTVGYAAVQNSLFVLRAWLVDLSIPNPANAGALAKTYIEPLNEGGARKAAHEFSCDILVRFGAKCLFGTHIYFVRRTGSLKAPVA